jgi:hypothetical protein
VAHAPLRGSSRTDDKIAYVIFPLSMTQPTSNGSRSHEKAKSIESEEDAARIRRHLKEVIEGAAFKGSHRSGQFLRYIVEQAIAGRFESLKERVIGVNLFGRSPTYDTGDDAIVRVTASDVRRRLLQHYGRYGAKSEYRISLPVGSYHPEFTRTGDAALEHQLLGAEPSPEMPIPHPADPSSANSMAAPSADAVQFSLPRVPAQDPRIPATPSTGTVVRHATLLYVFAFACVIVFASAAATVLWTHPAILLSRSVRVNPWATFVRSPHLIQIITSDPNIAEIQGFTGGQLSVSDYANHNYFTGPNHLTPEEDAFCRITLRGDKATTVDTQIAAAIAQLAQSGSKRVVVHGARNVRLSDLRGDDNFIILGSPRSNPWFALFDDQLDFQFIFEPSLKQEYIRNLRPRNGEQARYVPTAPGWATGQSYAILAVVRNPNQNGNVVLIAGADGEGTEATGELITDPARLSTAIQSCGIRPDGPLHHFNMLLKLSTMAGSPDNVDVIACHTLPDGAGR